MVICDDTKADTINGHRHIDARQVVAAVVSAIEAEVSFMLKADIG